MLKENEQKQTEEVQSLSADYFNVDELEDRLELALTMMVNTNCLGNFCVADACTADANW